MNRPWMPLYIAEYLSDTSHLGAAESGAYLHLIMHYWVNGNLPDDDRKLSRIARMKDREWRKARPVIQEFFFDGWRHSRVERELAEAETIHERRALAGSKGGNARAKLVANDKQKDSNASSNATNLLANPASNGPALLKQLHLPSTKERKKDAADAAPKSDEADLFRRGKTVLGADAGGLITKLLKAKDGNIALARAAIEQASTKQDPREYIGAIVRGREHPDDGQMWDPGI